MFGKFYAVGKLKSAEFFAAKENVDPRVTFLVYGKNDDGKGFTIPVIAWGNELVLTVRDLLASETVFVSGTIQNRRIANRWVMNAVANAISPASDSAVLKTEVIQ